MFSLHLSIVALIDTAHFPNAFYGSTDGGLLLSHRLCTPCRAARVGRSPGNGMLPLLTPPRLPSSLSPGGLPLGAIIGIVAGAVLLVAVAAALLLYFRAKRDPSLSSSTSFPLILSFRTTGSSNDDTLGEAGGRGTVGGIPPVR